MTDITGPDGQIYRFPDHISREKIESVMRRKFSGSASQTESVPPIDQRPQQPQTSEEETQEKPRELSPMAQDYYNRVQEAKGKPGFTEYVMSKLPFADEISGLVGGLETGVKGSLAGRGFEFSPGYEAATEASRRRTEEYEAENPWLSKLGLGVSVLGTAGPNIAARGAGLVPGLARAVSPQARQAPIIAEMARAAPVPGFASRVGQGVSGGAQIGGLYGFAEGEGGLENRLESAAGGAIAGGLLGGAMPVAGAVLAPAGRAVRNVYQAARNPREVAARKLAEAQERDAVTAQQATQQLAADRAAGIPDTALVDVGGRNVMRLARSARTMPGPGSEQIERFLTERQAAASGQVERALEPGLGRIGNYERARQDISTRMQTRAAPVYQAAYQRQIPITQDLQDLMQRPDMQEAARRATRLMQNEGIPINTQNSTQFFDYVKRGLDDLHSTAIRANEKNYARTVNNLRRGLDAIVERANPTLARAREIYAGEAGLNEAAELGQQFWNQNPRAIAENFRRFSQARRPMTAGERQIYRLSIADATATKIRGVRDAGDVYNQIFGNQTKRAMLRQAFPDPQSFGAFRRVMESVAQKQTRYRQITGGSQTVDKAAELEDAGRAVELVSDMLTGGIPAAARAVGKFVANQARRLTGLTPEVASNVANMITATAPGQQAEVMRLVLQSQERAGANARTLNFLRRITNNITSQALGRVAGEQDEMAGAQ